MHFAFSIFPCQLVSMARIWWRWVGDTWWSNEWVILREFHNSVNDHEIFKLQDWMSGWGWGRNVRMGREEGDMRLRTGTPFATLATRLSLRLTSESTFCGWRLGGGYN